MAVTAPAALRGAIGFLTRLPVGHDDRAWAAFREHPVVLVLAGYVVGGLLVPALAVPLPAAAATLLYVGWVYAVTGINHLDGLADLGDALVVHGDADRRRAVMTDTTTGVGALLAVGLVLAGLVLAGGAIARAPLGAVGLVLAAEVAAKLGMAAVVCFGTAAHDGLGAQLTDRARARSFAWSALAAVPAALATWPRAAGAVALAAGLGAALLVLAWARARLGGVSGDVIGAANEVGRVVALHAGVVAWTRC
ncbi:MAG: adenosylcobinamide-GDP ribazoletransferase [Halobacteriales archaeon]